MSGMRESEEVQMYNQMTGALRNIIFSGKEIGQEFQLDLTEYNRETKIDVLFMNIDAIAEENPEDF